MKKINKPDSPKRKGGDHSESGREAATGLLRWPTTTTIPNANEFVTAIFWGLMGFCYNTRYDSSAVCEVGFHPGDNNHGLEVMIYELNGSGCNLICPRPKGAPKIRTMTLKVVGQGDPPTVFQTSDNPFNRFKVDDDTGNGHELDFRWMPDLDGADFYPQAYPKNKHLKARLYVSNGVFYTRLRTQSTFKLVDADEHTTEFTRFSHVAMFMAAAIKVQNPTDYVCFQINDEPACKLEQKPGVRYQIVFKNECQRSCPDPTTINDPDEKKRNDFHFCRKLLKLPSNSKKLALKVDQRVSPGAEPNFCYDRHEVTDEAPCMGAGYGQTNGFPPP